LLRHFYVSEQNSTTQQQNDFNSNNKCHIEDTNDTLNIMTLCGINA